jgi:hypothetical protein
MISKLFRAAAAAAMVAAPGLAQVVNEFDFDVGTLPVVTIPPNGAVHVIATDTVCTGQNLVLNAALEIRPGAELRLVNSRLTVHGGVTVRDGGRLTVIDSSLLLPNQWQMQREFRIEGGVVHTERATIGSTWTSGYLQQTRFLHLRGAWVARETVVQALVPILSYGRGGWDGNPDHKGGSLFADGMYQGDRADGIHASGLGDVTLANGAMNVAFYYDAGVQQGSNAVLDLDARNRLNLVYGDPALHSGVTVPIASHLNRLELHNHHVPSWFLFTMNGSMGGASHTITLRNAEDIICSFIGHDLVGSPILGGPWSSYYGALPGLPSTARPGHHALPPSCSVRLGNVTYQSGSGPGDWNRIRYWGLYTQGTGTNLTIAGPTSFAELQMQDGGQLNLLGTGSFDMGVLCEAIRLYGTSRLHMANVALGAFEGNGGNVGIVEAHDSSGCTIDTARAMPLRLRTTSPSASITARNVFGGEGLILDNGAGGSVQLLQAAPAQNSDLQNLGFESGVSGGVPRYWAALGMTASAVSDTSPGAPGSSCVALSTQSVNAVLGKQLTLPPQTLVDVVAATKITQAPGNGQVWLQVANGANVQAAPLPLSPLNAWRRVHVPLLTTGATTPLTGIELVAGGVPASLRLDDVRVRLGSWWEADNLGNLDFELGCRYQGVAPTYSSSPDCWNSWSVSSANDASVRRPGSSGSQSIRTTLQGSYGALYKDLTVLRPGDTVVVRGWTRAVGTSSGAFTQLNIGDGPNFHLNGYSTNRTTGPLPADGTWRQFQVTYSPPANPTYTRLYLGWYGAAGAQAWWDDLTVEIQ